MSFKLVSTVPHPDRKSTVHEYIHEQTGLRHIHLDSDFPEKNFVLSVNTPPVDDTGMPHILEHLTLCGGQKYPSKDPFMAMQYRSVAHHMNAHTTPDHTSYYFSTTLENDFANMSDLYLDLVLTPLLRQADFEQEGWRLDRDANGDWTFKGVVLNEMKGVYSSPHSGVMDALMQTYAPGTPFANNYGGHPTAIPALSFERLKQFHSKHYAPEKAIIATSGDIDLSAFHERVEQAIARHQSVREKNPDDVVIAPAPTRAFYQLPKRQTDQGLVVEIAGPEQTPTLYTKLMLKDAPVNPEQELFEQMMTTALFGSATSVLKRVAKDNGLGSASAEYLFHPFKKIDNTVGLLWVIDGVSPEDQKKLDALVDQILIQTMEKGLDPHEWRGAVAEMRQSVESGIDASPRSVLLDISSCALMNIDPLSNANNREILLKLEQNVPSQEEVRAWLEEFIKGAKPSLSIVTNPELSRQWDVTEKSHVEDLVISGAQPSKEVKPEQNADLLPCINEDEIVLPARHNIEQTTSAFSVRQAAHTHYDITSPRALVGVMWDLGKINPSIDDQFLIEMWCNLLPHLGTRDQTFEKHQPWEDAHGLSVSWDLKVMGNLDNQAGLAVSCTVSGLSENSSQMAQALLDRTAGVPTFEEDLWMVTAQSLKDQAQSWQTKLRQQLAQAKALAPFSNRQALTALQYQEQLNRQVDWLSSVTPDQLRQSFERVWSLLGQCPKHVVSMGSTQTQQAGHRVAKDIGPGLVAWNNLSAWTPVPVNLQSLDLDHVQADSIVNHCYKAIAAPRLGEAQAPSFDVAINLLSPWIHEEIREKGGAYGAFTTWTSGFAMFSSFRDPHVDETFEVFRQVPDVLEQIVTDRDPSDLLGVKINMVKSALAPKPPFAQAMEMMQNDLSGVSYDLRKKHIESVLRVGWDDVALAVSAVASAPSTEVALTSKSKVQKKSNPSAATLTG